MLINQSAVVIVRPVLPNGKAIVVIISESLFDPPCAVLGFIVIIKTCRPQRAAETAVKQHATSTATGSEASRTVLRWGYLAVGTSG